MCWTNGIEIDRVPRYAPQRVVIARTRAYPYNPGYADVLGVKFHVAGSFGSEVPVRRDANCIEVITEYGSRWFGCERAYINSELRMVVVGFPAKFEEMARWLPVPEHLCVEAPM